MVFKPLIILLFQIEMFSFPDLFLIIYFFNFFFGVQKQIVLITLTKHYRMIGFEHIECALSNMVVAGFLPLLSPMDFI